MIILGIETSCDDTGAAIIEAKDNKINILSNIVSSQTKLHAQYGGVFPTLAKREHQKNLPIVFAKAIKEAKVKLSEIDAIAITVGPGLEPCLWIGINFAKTFEKPIIPINHIEAHILTNLIHDKDTTLNPKLLFPALALAVSGGHTQLALIQKIGQYKIIGETRDDAAGECFDKTARILGLEYPGGPAIAKKAARFSLKDSQFSINLPRPMLNTKDYDFSFSGLKTAVLYDFKNREPTIQKSSQYIIEMSFNIQQAIIDVLIKKTLKAARDFSLIKSIILGGGVSANDELIKQFEEKIKNLNLKINFLYPKKDLTGDNALMIATTGYFNKNQIIKPGSEEWKNIKANANLRI